MTNLSSLRVLIAEDQALVRQGMAALLEMDVDEVVEAEDGEDALRLLTTGSFDIALLDIGLPKRLGIDVLKDVRRRKLPVKIIMLTGDTENYAPSALFAAGADGFVYKTADADKLMETFISVAEGRVLHAEPPQDGENAATVAELRQRLTDRELQIVKLVVEGASNKETASVLCISEHTVRKHREHINRKLGAASPAALAAFAIKSGLV